MDGCRDEVKEFRAPFRGLRGSWRLMSLLRWGNPAEVLASIPALLPAISAPALVFHGSQDRAVPEAFARRACELLPQSELILLNPGHFLPLSEPEAVAARLVRFLHLHERPVQETALAATAAGMPR